MFLGYFLVSALEHSFSLGVQNGLRLSFHAEGYIFLGGALLRLWDRGAGHWAMFPTKFEIFLIFPDFLKA